MKVFSKEKNYQHKKDKACKKFLQNKAYIEYAS